MCHMRVSILHIWLIASGISDFRGRQIVCGIAGFFGRSDGNAPSLVRAMIDALHHRGPDDSGVEVLEQGQLVLGQRRLSILDLSPLGHQPMISADKRAWIVFNGEVYNFRELKRELEAAGRTFKSESDTEVILEAYCQWGLDAFKRFRGMFAFALWDVSRKKLHLCRDRFGVKPLYFCKSEGRLIFASELRALNISGITSRRIDPQAAAEFLQYGYVSSDTSIFSDVHAVGPGVVVTFDESLTQSSAVFWSATDLFHSEQTRELRRELASLPDEALLDRVEQALTEAFQYRMVADVPVGLFLSGGIDSSTVATILARRAGVSLRTFTIGYGDSEFDETPYAREVASRLGAEHTELIVSEQTALQVVELLPEIADEPIGDSSMIPTYLVSKLARQHVTVALSADGADELFGGYARYDICSRFIRRQSVLQRAMYGLSAEVIDRLPPALIAKTYTMTRGRGGGYAGINDKIRKFVRMSRANSHFEAYDASISEWTARDAAALLVQKGQALTRARKSFESVSDVSVEEEFMHFDTVRYLPGDLLTKVDRASMAVSLEAREPFLDHELARIAVALPMKWKIRDGQNKYVLRRILARHLPAELFERPKKGFSAPVGAWLRGPLRELLMHELSPARVKDIGLLDNDAVQVALKDFLGAGRRVSPAGMWFLLQLQQWAGRWVKAERPSLAA